MAKDCRSNVLKFFGDSLKKGLITEPEIDDILKTIEDIRKNIFATGGGSKEFQEAFNELFGNIKKKNLADQAAIIHNRNSISQRIEIADQEVFRGDIRQGILAATVGGAGVPTPFGNRSPYVRGRARQRLYTSNFINALEDADLKEKLQTAPEGLEKDIYTELFQFETDRFGSTKNADAVAAAKIIRGLNDQILADKNTSGIRTGRLPDFIVPRSYDNMKVKDMGLDTYLDLMLGKDRNGNGSADIERTLGLDASEQRMSDFFTEAWNDKVFGKFDRPDANGDDITDQFSSKWNLKRRNIKSKSRKIHFKSGSHEFEVMKQIGREGGLYRATLNHIERASKSMALVESLGTNPLEGYKRFIAGTKKKLRARGDSENLKRIEQMEADGTVDEIFNEISGESQAAGITTKAKYGRWFRSLTNLRFLANAGVRGMTDLASSSAILRSTTGENFWSAHAKMVDGYMASMTPARKKDFARKMNALVTDELGAAVARFHDGEISPGGIMSKAEQLFFRANGTHWQTTTARLANERVFSMELFDRAGDSFDKLDTRFRASLERYGVDDIQWDILREAKDEFYDGNGGITVEGLDKLSDARISEIVGGRSNLGPKALRQEAKLNLLSYVGDQGELGSPNPNARTRLFLLAGENPDTTAGFVRRFMAQFRSHAVTMHQVLGRAVLSNPDKTARTIREAVTPFNGKTADIDNLVGMVLSASALAYVADSAIQIANGKTPRDPFNPETAIRAFTQSGMGGLYADFGSVDYSSPFNSVASTALGPFGQDLEKAVGFGAGLIRAVGAEAGLVKPKTKKPKPFFETQAKAATKLLGGFIPFQNAPLIRPLYDYTAGYRIQEMLNDGSIRRKEKAVKEAGQSFFVDPSEVL